MLPFAPHPDAPNASKRVPLAITGIVMLVLLSPVVENWKTNPRDSFPLSHFPMFSSRRGETFKGESIVGIDAQGNRRILDYDLAGAGGFNQVRRQVRAKVKAGQAEDLCTKVAKRLARSRRKENATVERVQILSVTHNVDAFFAGNRQPVSEKLHAACEVPGKQPVAQRGTNDLQEVQR